MKTRIMTLNSIKIGILSLLILTFVSSSSRGQTIPTSISGTQNSSVDSESETLHFRYWMAPWDQIDLWPWGTSKYYPVKAEQFEKWLAILDDDARKRSSRSSELKRTHIDRLSLEARLEGTTLVDGLGQIFLSDGDERLANGDVSNGKTRNDVGRSDEIQNPSDGEKFATASDDARRFDPVLWEPWTAGFSSFAIDGFAPAAIGLFPDGFNYLINSESSKLSFRWTLRGESDPLGVVRFDLNFVSAPISELVLTLPLEIEPRCSVGIVQKLESADASTQKWVLRFGGCSKARLTLSPVAVAANIRQKIGYRQENQYNFNINGTEVVSRVFIDRSETPLDDLTIVLDQPLTLISVEWGDYRQDRLIQSRTGLLGTTRLLVRVPPEVSETGAELTITALTPTPLKTAWRLPGIRILSGRLFWKDTISRLSVSRPLVATTFETIDSVQVLEPRSGSSVASNSESSSPKTETFSFRYFELNATVALRLIEEPTKIRFDSVTESFLNPDEIYATTRLFFNVDQFGCYRLSLAISPDWIVDSVQSPRQDQLLWELSEPDATGFRTLTISLKKQLVPNEPFPVQLTASYLSSQNSYNETTIDVSSLCPLSLQNILFGEHYLSLRSESAYQVVLLGQNRRKIDEKDLATAVASPPAVLRDVVAPLRQTVLLPLGEASAGLSASLEKTTPNYSAEINGVISVRDSELVEQWKIKCVPPTGSRVDRLVVAFVERPLPDDVLENNGNRDDSKKNDSVAAVRPVSYSADGTNGNPNSTTLSPSENSQPDSSLASEWDWSIATEINRAFQVAPLSDEEFESFSFPKGTTAWEFQLQTSRSVPFEIEVSRRSVFNEKKSIPLIFFPETRSQTADVVVESPNLTPLRFDGVRLSSFPADLPKIDEYQTIEGTFRYQPEKLFDDSDYPQLILANSLDSVDRSPSDDFSNEKQSTTEIETTKRNETERSVEDLRTEFNAWCWFQRLDSQHGADGTIRNYATFYIENHGRTNVLFSLPPETSSTAIHAVWTDGQQTTWFPRDVSNDQEICVLLPNRKRFVSICLEYILDDEPLKSKYSLDLVCPKCELPTLSGTWGVWIPPEFIGFAQSGASFGENRSASRFSDLKGIAPLDGRRFDNIPSSLQTLIQRIFSSPEDRFRSLTANFLIGLGNVDRLQQLLNRKRRSTGENESDVGTKSNDLARSNNGRRLTWGEVFGNQDVLNQLFSGEFLLTSKNLGDLSIRVRRSSFESSETTAAIRADDLFQSNVSSENANVLSLGAKIVAARSSVPFFGSVASFWGESIPESGERLSLKTDGEPLRVYVDRYSMSRSRISPSTEVNVGTESSSPLEKGLAALGNSGLVIVCVEPNILCVTTSIASAEYRDKLTPLIGDRVWFVSDDDWAAQIRKYMKGSQNPRFILSDYWTDDYSGPINPWSDSFQETRLLSTTPGWNIFKTEIDSDSRHIFLMNRYYLTAITGMIFLIVLVSTWRGPLANPTFLIFSLGLGGAVSHSSFATFSTPVLFAFSGLFWGSFCSLGFYGVRSRYSFRRLGRRTLASIEPSDDAEESNSGFVSLDKIPVDQLYSDQSRYKIRERLSTPQPSSGEIDLTSKIDLSGLSLDFKNEESSDFLTSGDETFISSPSPVRSDDFSSTAKFSAQDVLPSSVVWDSNSESNASRSSVRRISTGFNEPSDGSDASKLKPSRSAFALNDLDSSQTDDSLKADSRKTDSRRTDSQKNDPSQIDSQKVDSRQIDSQKTDSSQTDSRRIDPPQIIDSLENVPQTRSRIPGSEKNGFRNKPSQGKASTAILVSLGASVLLSSFVGAIVPTRANDPIPSATSVVRSSENDASNNGGSIVPSPALSGPANSSQTSPLKTTNGNETETTIQTNSSNGSNSTIPANAASVENPFREPYRVFVPVDDDQKPKPDSYIWLEEEFYEKLRQAIGRSRNKDDHWQIVRASYEGAINYNGFTKNLSFFHLKATFQIRLEKSQTTITLPMMPLASDANATFDKQPILPIFQKTPSFSTDASLETNAKVAQSIPNQGNLVFEIENAEPGLHTLELLLAPPQFDDSNETVEIPIPRVLDSRLELTVPSDAPPVLVERTFGVVSQSGGILAADLGPVDRIVFRRQEELGKLGQTSVDVEQLFRLRLRPNQTELLAQFRYRIVGGKIKTLFVRSDKLFQYYDQCKCDEAEIESVDRDETQKDLIRITFKNPVSGNLTLTTIFVAGNFSGVGQLRLPEINATEARITRSWLGLFETSNVECVKIPESDVAVSAFQTAWGANDEVPLAVYNLLSANPDWVISIRLRTNPPNVSERLNVVFNATRLNLIYSARLESVQEMFRCSFQTNEPFELESLEIVDDKGAKLEPPESFQESGRLYLFFPTPLSGTFQLKIVGKTTARLDEEFAIPILEMENLSGSTKILSLYRKHSVYLDLKEPATWTTAISEASVPALSVGESNLANDPSVLYLGSYNVPETENFSAASVRIRQNLPIVSGGQRTLLFHGANDRWEILVNFSLNVQNGELDRLEIELDELCSGSLEIEPSFAINETFLDKKRRLTLKPSGLVRGNFKFQLRTPIDATLETLRLPKVSLVPQSNGDYSGYQTTVLLPIREQYQWLQWDLNGLVLTTKPEASSNQLSRPTAALSSVVEENAIPKFATEYYDMNESDFDQYIVDNEHYYASVVSGQKNSQVLEASHHFYLRKNGTFFASSIIDLAVVRTNSCVLAFPGDQQVLDFSIDGINWPVESLGDGRWKIPLNPNRYGCRLELTFTGTVASNVVRQERWLPFGTRKATETRVVVPYLENIPVNRNYWIFAFESDETSSPRLVFQHSAGDEKFDFASQKIEPIPSDLAEFEKSVWKIPVEYQNASQILLRIQFEKMDQLLNFLELEANTFSNQRADLVRWYSRWLSRWQSSQNDVEMQLFPNQPPLIFSKEQKAAILTAIEDRTSPSSSFKSPNSSEDSDKPEIRFSDLVREASMTNWNDLKDRRARLVETLGLNTVDRSAAIRKKETLSPIAIWRLNHPSNTRYLFGLTNDNIDQIIVVQTGESFYWRTFWNNSAIYWGIAVVFALWGVRRRSLRNFFIRNAHFWGVAIGTTLILFLEPRFVGWIVLIGVLLAQETPIWRTKRRKRI